MNIIVDVAVAAVDDVVYGLATRLFKSESPKRLALVPPCKARATNVIPLINLGLLIVMVIYLKLKGKLPWLLSAQVLILVLLSAASLGWLIHPHVIDYAGARLTHLLHILSFKTGRFSLWELVE